MQLRRFALKADFDFASSYLFAAAMVFNSDFNNIAPITSDQAWSLFFTAGREDAILGFNPNLEILFNHILLRIVLTVALSSFVLQAF